MKQRLISAAAGLLFLAAVLFLSDFHHYVFNAVVAVLAVLSVAEIFTVTQAAASKTLLCASLIFAALVPFREVPLIQPYFGLIFFAYLTVLLLIMLLARERISLQTVCVSFFLCTLVPYAFSLLVTLRDMGSDPASGLAKRDGVFLLLLACGGAWLADTGAFFIGRKWGKRPLAPAISPKKTIEGFIGGVAVNLIGLTALTLVYEHIYSAGAHINLPFVLIFGLLAAFFGTLGDLSASHIKRTCHVKDFGSIMPGHGGVMDRFDSILTVAPLLFLMLSLFSPIWPLIVR